VSATANGNDVQGFGEAKALGSLGSTTLNKPIVGITATPNGAGYWLVASDGGIFTFGNAHFYGSLGNKTLNKPIVGITATPNGAGYWLVASDGGIFTFGNAHFYGSAAAMDLSEPVGGMARDPAGGYWIFETGVSTPVELFTPDLVSQLDARAGVVSAAVVDLDSGYLYQYRPGQQDITASIVKVQILATLLAQAQAVGRALSPAEQSLATSMIEESDNDAATALWDDVGGAPAVQAFDRSVGMNGTFPAFAWGLTVTTALDQVILLQHLVLPNPVLSSASRSYELGLMESVTPTQAWGVSAGAAPGTSVALKNGWLPVGPTWQINSVGWVHGSGRDYLIAVLTSGNPSEEYGIQSVGLVAGACWATLVDS
jgi:hypothetical protein